MSPLIPAIVDADAPYDSTTFADTILRTSDNVHFYIVGNMLCYVSPFFRDLFDLNRGAAAEQNEKKDGFLVIHLLDDSATLRLLLDFIYPRIGDPLLDNVTLFWNASKAAKKYCMDIVEGKLKDRIVASELIKKEPLRIYAVATDLEWDDIANVAARNTLGTQLKHLTYVVELRSISGAGFYRFLEYRLRCNTSARSQEERLSMITDYKLNSSSASDPASELDGRGRFHPSSMADLILRSSDSIDFFVVAAVVRLVSPVFDAMFPLKDHESKDGLPVILVQESSRVLLPLLRIVYHDIDELDTTDCQLYREIVLAVRKYGMTSIERKLRKQIATSSLILTEPLRIYILATIIGLGGVQRGAALNTLSRPLEEMTYTSELKLITGADLYKLVRFRFRCGDEACAALVKDKNFSSYGLNNWSTYRRSLNPKSDRPSRPSRPSHPSHPSPPFQLLDWSGSLRACPRGSTMANIYTKRIEEVGRIDDDLDFRSTAFCGVVKCIRSAENVVEQAVSRVRFQCPFQSSTHIYSGPPFHRRHGLTLTDKTHLRFGSTVVVRVYQTCLIFILPYVRHIPF